MSPFFDDPAMSATVWITLKASLLLAAAAIAQALVYRRRSAATRHLIWTFAIAGLLMLPVLSVGLPGWPVVIRTAPPRIADAVSSAPVVDRVGDASDLATPSAPPAVAAVREPSLPETSGASTPDPRPTVSVSWTTVMARVYVAGLLLMLIQLAMHWRGVRRLARESTDVHDAEWQQLLSACADSLGVDRPVRLLRSRASSMPMAFGIRRPAILIPAIADTWPDDRRRAVLLHELAHVARYDCLTQTLAFAACAMYWFHPAAWWVARRLRIERELACDDLVIAAGTQAREYAGHLLEIAFAFGKHRAPALAVSMARPHQLESRMLAVLDAARNRSVPAWRVRVAGAAIAAALVLPLATAAPTVAAAKTDSETSLAGRDVVLAERTAPKADSLPARQQESAPARHLRSAPWEAFVRRIVDAAAAAIGIPQEQLPGTWEIRPARTDGTVHLRLVEVNSSSGSNVPIQRLEGLTAAQLSGAGGPVQFRMRRDAGTFTFEGVLRQGVGAGTFSFAASPDFPAELAKRGFGRPTAVQQYQMARHDIGFEFLDELNKQGYAKPDLAEVVRAGQHGVNATYLRDMGALGYRLGSLAPLIELRDHGVTPEYVRGLADLGYAKLSADELRRARDHGVTPEYVRGMRDGGYSSLTMDQLINARDHGVTPEFVRGLGNAGHSKLALDEVIRVRDHGVSPEYVRDMRQLGHNLPIAELIRSRDHGVDVEYVRGMTGLGYTSLTMDALIRLRDHGVTPKYAQEVKALGYDRLTPDDLVTLRDHGLTPDRIRAANARAGSRLPVDLLKSLAAGGMR